MRLFYVSLFALTACFAANDIRTAPEDTQIDTGFEGEEELDDPGADTGDSGDTAVEDTGTDPGPDPIVTDEACYLGPSRDFAVCLPVGVLDPLPTAYEYPAPLDGSAQYLEPVAYLDLDALSPSEALAPNFVLSEFAQARKGRYAVVQPHAVERIQDLRDELGPLVVNSGYRSPEYNAGVGGATWSRHMYGDAFDIDPVSVGLSTLAAACEAHGAGYVGVYETHIHCDWRDDPMSVPFYGGQRRLAEARRPELGATIARRADGVLTAPAVGWDEGEPLRDWTAYAADGQILSTARSRTFAPPADAVRVEVRVGLAVTAVAEVVK